MDESSCPETENLDAHFEAAWERYYKQLVKFARGRLGVIPRRDADEEDVALSAMKSFYRGLSEGRLPRLSGPDDLWKLLLTITARKASKRVRYHQAKRRGDGKVRGESVFDRNGVNGGLGLEDLIAADLSPSEAAQVIGQCQEMLDALGEESLIRVATMKLEGYTNEEIANELSCAVRTVERKLFRIRLKWEPFVEANGEQPPN